MKHAAALTRPLRRRALVLSPAALALLAFAGPAAASTASPAQAPLSCEPGDRQEVSTPAEGVQRTRCLRTLMPYDTRPVSHGPERLVASDACAGAEHRLSIERMHIHGMQVGVERATLDGAPLYEVRWDGGRLTAFEPARGGDVSAATTRKPDDAAAPQPVLGLGVGTNRLGQTCRGAWLCGRLIGFAACSGRGFAHQGAWIDGVEDGHGERDLGDKVIHVGGFVGGRAHGVAEVYGADGSEFEGWYEGGRREGFGRTRFADGSWRTATWVRGELHGRVTRATRDGNREVTVWRHGQRQHEVERWQKGADGALTRITRPDSVQPVVEAKARRFLLWLEATGPEEHHILTWQVSIASPELASDLLPAAIERIRVVYGIDAQGLKMMPTDAGRSAMAKLLAKGSKVGDRQRLIWDHGMLPMQPTAGEDADPPLGPFPREPAKDPVGNKPTAVKKAGKPKQPPKAARAGKR